MRRFTDSYLIDVSLAEPSEHMYRGDIKSNNMEQF